MFHWSKSIVGAVTVNMFIPFFTALIGRGTRLVGAPCASIISKVPE